MIKRTFVFFAFLVFSINLYAATPDLKSKRIGILNRIGDKAVLAYQAAPSPMRGTDTVKISYYAAPQWRVRSEINNSLIKHLQSFDQPLVIDLNYKSENLNDGFYIEGGNLGQKYIQKLIASPEVKGLDYILIIFPTGRYMAGPDMFIPTGSIFTSIPGPGQVTMQYGFQSGYTGGVKSFFSTAFLLFNLKSLKIILSGDASQAQVFGYEKKLDVHHRKYIYKTIKHHLTDQRYLGQIRDLVINSKLTESDKNEIRRIFKEAFGDTEEYEDDFNEAMIEIDHAMATNIITPTHFSVSITENTSQAFDKHIEDLQRLAVEDIVRQIKSGGK